MESKKNQLILTLQHKGITDLLVLEAIRSTPRELFVPESITDLAYEDNALSIECGQTISQPYVVAKMTELVIEKKPQKVLEIGTGSGYQAAILSKLVPAVYSIERIKSLYDEAKERLAQLNLGTIHLRYDDGTLGWAEEAPFDAIVVTAAASEIPENLLIQLSEGGRLVIPVGGLESQFIYLIEKHEGRYVPKKLDMVRFVPLLEGKEGYR
jgi:protein-L-isoaspartate(D-aspartate) O-methyltransferase